MLDDARLTELEEAAQKVRLNGDGIVVVHPSTVLELVAEVRRLRAGIGIAGGLLHEHYDADGQAAEALAVLRRLRRPESA